MIAASKVSAVLVTRGDVDLTPILDSLPFKDIVVWNNAERPEDLSCYGRYAAIAEAKNQFIYHQDDDLIVPVGELLAAFDPTRDRYGIVSNNRIDEEWPLTGIGSVFHRDLADCFDAYTALYGYNADFFRIADVVFAYQHPYRRIVRGYTDLPWQTAWNRMYRQVGHGEARHVARARTFALPDRI